MVISSLRVVRVISATSFLVTLGYFALPTQAQVVGDRTVDSQIRVDNQNLVITGGKEAGQNLFHSFSEFSVPANFKVHFDNGANIENIFSRVTGGAISNIDGLIKTNDSASLFLLNPAGIIFGENAQLDIGGSFIATTAEAIVFDDGVFSAVDTDSQPMLTVNIPIGLQYGQSPGQISAEGKIVDAPPNTMGKDIENPILEVKPHNTLALVGGEVFLAKARIQTAGGNLEIGSVANEEFVTLKKNNQVWEFNYDGVDVFSPIKLDKSSILSRDGGSIQIRGKDIILTDTAIRNPIVSNTHSEDIQLIATNAIELNSSAILTTSEDISNSPGNNTNTDTEKSSVNDVNILLRGNRILFSNGYSIAAETFGQRDGGGITIEAKDSIELSGQLEVDGLFFPSFITTSTEGSGAGGKIKVTANSLILEDGGMIESRAEKEGNGGDINITTDTLVLFDVSTITANAEQGNGGAITITTQGLFAASGIDEQITADAGVNGIEGIVEINTPDVDSQVDTKVVERSPLVVENLIYTGCNLGEDYISNKFSYIGRGGLPLNPMQEIATEDLMVDLGELELPQSQHKMNQSISFLQDKSHQEIREVTSWVVNQKGNIELIAPTTKVADSSICLLQHGGNIDID